MKFRLPFLPALTALLLTLTSATASAQEQRTVVITGTAAANGFVILCIRDAPAVACGSFLNCAPFGVSGPAGCSIGDPPSVLAAGLAAGVNSDVIGFSAVAVGGSVTVTGPVGVDFELCTFTSETAGCPGGNDVGLSNCVVNNVCNGVPCDETSAHVSGYQMQVSTPAPAMPRSGLGFLLLGLAGVGILFASRVRLGSS